MNDIQERIAQFENMTLADPTNDMAHFSLGTAYLLADRFEEAAGSLMKCLELNPEMSKAAQMAGEALIKAGKTDKAIEVLDSGYATAAGRGDMMPKNAIAELLKSIGREPPEIADEEQAVEAAEAGSAFICRCTGRAGTQLPDLPMRGPVGQWIYENIGAETWRDWIAQGTKVINELRLDFSREQDQEVYEQHMCEYLGIDAALYEELVKKV